ncbi:MAG: hypothetical protein BWZ09_02526 [Alphaproteobacteria bacterium ADurb.BinA305]|nr:MAG: hypothetical protein BWZ09_02526 [Alphaproteobacteria bacterium ADurb.BinA305]
MGLGLGLPELPALHRDEARAEALHAGQVLVAAVLVDGALAAELGLERLNAHAVALHAAVAAAFADQLVDDDARRRRGQLAALPAPAFLGGAGLVVEDGGGAGDLAELALHAVQFVAVVHRHAGRQRHAGVLLGLVADDAKARHALADHARHDLQHRVPLGSLADLLTAGHGHRVVVEDLVGDVDAGGDRLADRQDAAVEVGAVAEVGKDVLLGREGLLADPGHALAAHLREGAGVAARHPAHHVVAADAGDRPRTFGNAGAGVVRAAAAEPGRALGAAGHLDLVAQRAVLGLDDGQAGVEARRHVGVDTELLEALGDGARDQRRRQVGLRAQQPVLARVGQAPFAPVERVVVELAQHMRAHVGVPVVELLLDLVLDDLALLLDDEDLPEAGGEFARDVGFQRPDHVDLVQAHAEPAAGVVVEAEVVQRLARVVVGLARGDQAEAILRGGDHVVVEPVGADVGQRGVPLVVHHARLLLERRIGPADVQPPCGHLEVLGHQDLHAVRAHVHRGAALDDLLDRLHAAPQARIAAQREGVQAHVEDVLHRGGKEHREADRLEHMVALVRGRRALGDVVVAGDGDHAAVPGRAGHIGVLEDVDAAVHPRALAVPDAEHAVVALLLGIEVELLGAPDRGGAELLVDARAEHHMVFLQVLARRPQRLVVAPERRAAVAADEAGGVEAAQRVGGALQHGQAHQGLHAAHEGAAAFERVFVVQRDGLEGAADVLGQRGVHRGRLPARGEFSQCARGVRHRA